MDSSRFHSSQRPSSPKLDDGRSSSRFDSLRTLQHDAWMNGKPIAVEDLVKTVAGDFILDESQQLELVLAERELRRATGRDVEPTTFVNRFPHLKQHLLPQLQADDELDTASRDPSIPHDLNATCDPASDSATATQDLATTAPAERHGAPATPNQQTTVNDLVGSKTLGKYRLVARLGQGGMGAVYSAAHTLINHRVALKVMLPHLIQRPELQQRFLSEAQICVSLQHPHLVRTFDVDSDAGCLFLTMELLDGKNLAETVATDGALPADLVYMIVRQAAAGLAHAHSKGIVHRDIKPQNIMLTLAGDVKVLDLGLAKLRDDYNDWQGAHLIDQTRSDGIAARHLMPIDDSLSDDERLTVTGSVMGTVAYMAPEQARDPRAADARSDLFSLGCTAYFLLTGESPHLDSAMVDVLKAKLHHDHWHDLSLDSIPKAWRPILERMLAWNANDRFPDMEQLIVEMDRVFGDGSIWLPQPDDLETLRTQLLRYQIIDEAGWERAFDVVTADWQRTQMQSTIMPTGEVRVSAFEMLFALAKPSRPETRDAAMTNFQVQQILAGQIAALRLPDHVILECLNKGWKGEAFKCRRVSNQNLEVVRLIPLDKLRGLGDNDFDREQQLEAYAEKLLQVDHPLVSHVRQCQLHDEFAIVATDLVLGVTLRREVREQGRRHQDDDWERVLTSALEMANSVNALHQAGLLHLDLSTERFVRKSNQSLYLIDPGIAGMFLPRRGQHWPDDAQVPPVIAPEMLDDLSAATTASDVYALGYVFQFLRTGELESEPTPSSDVSHRHSLANRHTLPSRPATPQKAEAIPAETDAPTTLAQPQAWRTAFDDLVQRMTHDSISDRIPTLEKVLAELHQILEAQRTTHTRNENLEAASAVNRRIAASNDADRSFTRRLSRGIRQLFKRT